MTPVTGCSVKWKVQMRWEKCLPKHKPNFHPWLCVCAALTALCWVAGGDTLSLVLVLRCALCATLFSGLGRGTQSKNTGTLLRAAEGRVILSARCAINHPRTPRSNTSVLCGEEMRIDMRHHQSGVQVQSKSTIKTVLRSNAIYNKIVRR